MKLAAERMPPVDAKARKVPLANRAIIDNEESKLVRGAPDILLKLPQSFADLEYYFFMI